MARIAINDLTAVQDLPADELAEIFGAGPKFRPSFENLESRELMASSLMASLSGGVLRIEGTSSADRIYIDQSPRTNAIYVGTTVNGAQLGVYAGADVSRIDIFALGGNDNVNLAYRNTAINETNPVRENVRIFGGSGDDFIQSGTGNDIIFGGDGSDSLGGGGGTDQLNYGNWAYLNSSGVAYRTLDGLRGQMIGSGFRELVQDTTGNAYALRNDGVIVKSASATGGNWENYSGGGFRDIAIDSSNRVHGLGDNGLLFRWSTSGQYTLLDRFVTSLSVSPTSALQVTRTEIGNQWKAQGGDAGALGEPTGDVFSSGDFQLVNFQKGVVYWSANTGAHSILGDPRDRNTFWGAFAHAGYQNSLGLPTSNEFTSTSGDQVVLFERGYLFRQPGGTISIRLTVDSNYHQISGWDCGVSSSARLMRWYGHTNVDRKTVENIVQINGDLQTKLGIMGATPQQYVNAMKRWEPNMLTESRSDFQKILDLLALGKPVIALLRVGEKEILGDKLNATTGATAGAVIGTLVPGIGPVVGAAVGALVGAANQKYQVPLLHYVVVNGINYGTGEIQYYDPASGSDGGQMSRSLSEFQGMWDWKIGDRPGDSLPGEMLRANNVHARTIIYNA